MTTFCITDLRGKYYLYIDNYIPIVCNKSHNSVCPIVSKWTLKPSIVRLSECPFVLQNSISITEEQYDEHKKTYQTCGKDKDVEGHIIPLEEAKKILTMNFPM